MTNKGEHIVKHVGRLTWSLSRHALEMAVVLGSALLWFFAGLYAVEFIARADMPKTSKTVTLYLVIVAAGYQLLRQLWNYWKKLYKQIGQEEKHDGTGIQPGAKPEEK